MASYVIGGIAESSTSDNMQQSVCRGNNNWWDLKFGLEQYNQFYAKPKAAVIKIMVKMDTLEVRHPNYKISDSYTSW